MWTDLGYPIADAEPSEHHPDVWREDSAYLRIQLLNGFQVSAGSEPPIIWHSRKATQLIKLLALAPDYGLHREQLLERLWPASSPAMAANSLRHTLHIARRALRTLPVNPQFILQTLAGRVYLYPPDRLWIDVNAFELAARAARNATDPDIYWTAIDRYTGPLLPDDADADWATSRRVTLESTYLALLDDVEQLHEVRGEYPQALAALRRLLDADPLHEAACVRIMRIYALTGRRSLALHQYRKLRQALEQSLDVPPEPATRALYIAIKEGQFPMLAPNDGILPEPAFAAGRTATNLPYAVSDFIGRARDISSITQLLKEHRLVTLTGQGGIGKTRLALEVAWKQVDAYPDGVWQIELATLSDPALLPQMVTGALGIQADGARSPIDRLVTTLRDTRLLLLLDNCEHLMVACAQLIVTLLKACPHLQILATSREKLHLQGELPWPVSSLPLPDPQAGHAILAENDSVRLFVDRIRWHQPRFTLTPENASIIGAICRRLDGLPLALELAAARAAYLTLPQLAVRLDDALGVLADNSRSTPARQRTLRATLDWSYTLLDEREQALFRRLAVFASGWTLQAAESVCSSEQSPEDAILSLLNHLVDKSLVQTDRTHDAARYSLLEPVRQYAMSLLEANGEADDLRERQATYVLTFLETIEPELSGPRQTDWFDYLDYERGNVRVALRWAVEQDRAEMALRMCAVLWRYWGIRWHSAEGLDWLMEARALSGACHTSAWAQAALGGGELARRVLDFELSQALLEESLEVHRERGDSEGIAWSQIYLANALGMAGDFDRSRMHAQESLTLFRALGDRLGIARALNALAEDARLFGDYTLAARYYQEALVLDRQLGDVAGIAVRRHDLGYIALHEGDVPRAVRSFRDSYFLNLQIGYQSGALSFLEGIAAAAGVAGQPERAARLYGAWEARCARPGTEFKLHPPDQAEYDRSLERVRAALSEAALTRAWASGTKLTLDQALAEALAFAAEIADTEASTSRAELLSHREREIAHLLAEGLTNHQIARTLGIAERTVDTHVSHVLRKLRISTRHQIAARLELGNFGPLDH